LVFAAVLSALRPACAGPPAITYVTQPVRHWETFFLLSHNDDKHKPEGG
jgi:hypothetical protein